MATANHQHVPRAGSQLAHRSGQPDAPEDVVGVHLVRLGQLFLKSSTSAMAAWVPGGVGCTDSMVMSISEASLALMV